MTKTEADAVNVAARHDADRLANMRVMTTAENAAMDEHFRAIHARGEHIVMTAEQVALKRAYWGARNAEWRSAQEVT